MIHNVWFYPECWKVASIVLSGSRWTLDEHLLFQRRLCRDGVVLMSTTEMRIKVLYPDPHFSLSCYCVYWTKTHFFDMLCWHNKNSLEMWI